MCLCVLVHRCVCGLSEGFVPISQLVLCTLQSLFNTFVVVRLCVFYVCDFLNCSSDYKTHSLSHTHSHTVHTHTEIIQKIVLYVFKCIQIVSVHAYASL